MRPKCKLYTPAGSDQLKHKFSVERFLCRCSCCCVWADGFSDFLHAQVLLLISACPSVNREALSSSNKQQN